MLHRIAAIEVTAAFFVVGITVTTGCRENVGYKIYPGPPPALPSADAIVDAKWKYLGNSEVWKPLSGDQTARILKLLSEAEELRKPDGTSLPMGGPLDPEVMFSTKDGKTFGVVFSLFNDQFWYGETVAGRELKPRSYAFPRELSQAELLILDPGRKVADQLNRPANNE